MYILSFDLDCKEDEENEDPEKEIIVLTITNGFDRLYQVELSYQFMSSQRQQSQIEGSWHAYFDLLLQALNGGKQNLKIVHSQAYTLSKGSAESQNSQT